LYVWFNTKKHTTMKTKLKEKAIEAGHKIKRFKIKLDYKTFITIKDLGTLDLWKERYPNAKLVGTIFS